MQVVFILAVFYPALWGYPQCCIVAAYNTLQSTPSSHVATESKSGVYPQYASASVFSYVPFTSQAPYYDWREPWQNFCEKVSVVMAAHFLWGLSVTRRVASEEMLIIKKIRRINVWGI